MVEAKKRCRLLFNFIYKKKYDLTIRETIVTMPIIKINVQAMLDSKKKLGSLKKILDCDFRSCYFKVIRFGWCDNILFINVYFFYDPCEIFIFVHGLLCRIFKGYISKKHGLLLVYSLDHNTNRSLWEN